MPRSVLHFVSGEAARRQLGLTIAQLVRELNQEGFGFCLCDGEVIVPEGAFLALVAARNKGAEDAA